MDTYFYLFLVEDDVDPTVEGPFVTEAERNEAAKEYRRSEFEGGIFPLNISAEVEPVAEVGTYSGAFYQEGEDEND